MMENIARKIEVVFFKALIMRWQKIKTIGATRSQHRTRDVEQVFPSPIVYSLQRRGGQI